MGGIIGGGSEYLIVRNGRWYKIQAVYNEYAEKFESNVLAHKFLEDNPNPRPEELPWYIEFISEVDDE